MAVRRHYTSNDGELPWYSGAINQNAPSGGSSSGSDSGSGDGSSSTPSTPTSEYNRGWNAAIASVAPAKTYYRPKSSDPDKGYFQGTTLYNAITVQLYDSKPSKKTGTTDYATGWNAAVDDFKLVLAYTGTSHENEVGLSTVTAISSVMRYQSSGTKS